MTPENFKIQFNFESIARSRFNDYVKKLNSDDGPDCIVIFAFEGDLLQGALVEQVRKECTQLLPNTPVIIVMSPELEEIPSKESAYLRKMFQYILIHSLARRADFDLTNQSLFSSFENSISRLSEPIELEVLLIAREDRNSIKNIEPLIKLQSEFFGAPQYDHNRLLIFFYASKVFLSSSFSSCLKSLPHQQEILNDEQSSAKMEGFPKGFSFSGLSDDLGGAMKEASSRGATIVKTKKESEKSPQFLSPSSASVSEMADDSTPPVVPSPAPPPHTASSMPSVPSPKPHPRKMEASSTTRSEKKKKPRQKSFFGKKASNTTRVSPVMESRDKELDIPPKVDAIEIENHEIKDLFEEDSEADLQEEFEVKPYHKNVAVEYYDVMNPENYYPLVVNISNIEIQDRDTRENLLTGERKTQKKTEMDLSLKTPLVYVRPLFPGCDVTPNQILTDLNKTEDTLEFFITPIVKGEISGKIEFVQDDHVVYSFPLDAEVKDPRYARTIAAYGLLASVFPKLLAFLDIDLGNAREITNVIPFLGKYKFFSSMSLTSFIAIAGGLIALIVGVLYFLRQSPSSKKKSYTLSN